MSSKSEESPGTDDAKRKFQEALERKRQKSGEGAVPREPGRSALPSGNDKRQRTFRRKSGG